MPVSLVFLAAEDFSGWSKLIVLVLFFVVPAIKAVLEARKKAAENSRKLEGRERAPAPEREAWESLLRGEEAPTPAPPPLPAAPRTPERSPTYAQEPAPLVELERTPPALAPVVSEDEEEARGPGEAETRGIGVDISSAQVALPSGHIAFPTEAELEATGAPVVRGALAAQAGQETWEDAGQSEAALRLGPEELRRAIAWSEILAGPVALRREHLALGPAGSLGV